PDLRTVDLEHVLCEDVYPHFRAEADNLAVACKPCNQRKGKADVLVDYYQRPPASYPDHGSFFTIPHPHFDTYSDYIEIKNRWYYEAVDGKNGKGEALIRHCKLNRNFESFSGLLEDITLNPMVDCCRRAVEVDAEGNKEELLSILSTLFCQFEDFEARRLVEVMSQRS
ncbi:MAG: hypothetical protein HQL39_10760, partial [Alphaproteobacteria bacterium]|nr:hypothetical protein [Alphaproteobacteria bacterium]